VVASGFFSRGAVAVKPTTEVKDVWNSTTIPYTLMINARANLHLHVLETNITNSVLLTREVREK
jgi:hypothetical protein